MNMHPDESFIYVTPLLEQIDRIKKNTDIGFVEPEFRGKRKIDDFNSLLCDGCNIATTHATFAHSTEETIDFLRQGNYTLILDEVLDVVTPFNNICNNAADMIQGDDIEFLLKEKLIEADQYGRITWIGNHYGEYKYSVIEKMARRGNLILIGDCLFLWEFPIDVFKSFKEVYVLTYLFDGSCMKPFLEYHSIPYKLYNVIGRDGQYDIIDYCGDDADRDLYKKLITFPVRPEHKMNSYKASSLSKTWFNNNVRSKKSSQALTLRKNIENFVGNIAKAKSSQVMWTCPKSYAPYLKGKGYTYTRSPVLTPEEKLLPKEEQDKLKNQIQCFVPCNARATNDYRDRDVLVYVCNMHINPNIVNFFHKKEVAIDNDAYALSCLIQWIWRSAIRDGKPIQIYMPSVRMRGLLGDWLFPEPKK